MSNFFDQGPESSFGELYQSMSESELRELAADWHSLVDEAQSSLVAEFARRGIAFVEPPQLSEEDEPKYRDLVTIRRYRDLSEAIVARGVVESAGIFCFLKDENLVRLDWQVSNLVGGIRLQVAAEDVEAAEAVLAQPIPDSISIPNQPGFEQPRCPRCGSSDISWERRGRKMALVSLFLLSLPLPRGSESWQCSNCGLRWTEDDETTTSMEETAR
jgi:hypothetical protein